MSSHSSVSALVRAGRGFAEARLRLFSDRLVNPYPYSGLVVATGLQAVMKVN